MARSRRQQVAVGIVGLLVAGGGYWFWSRAAATAPAASNLVGAGSKGPSTGTQAPTPDVHLDALQAARPTPDQMKRNLFRFKPKPVPPPPPTVVVSRPIAPSMPSGPPPPPPLSPIPLKFAGVVTQGAVKVAVLIDTIGHQIYGKEGETIEGRYKIWKIGTDSIDISYLDGRGRLAIRMNGSP